MEFRRKLLSVFLILLTETFYGQGLFESATAADENPNKPAITFSGYGRGSFYGGSRSYDFQSVFGEFGVQGKLSINHAFLFADLRARGGLQYDSLYTTLQLKEAYAGYQSDKFDIYLGEKIITWGRTDGFNPTNNITPFDYFFLTADSDDQKLPNFLLDARWHITSQINLEGIVIPFYKPSIYRYDLFDLNESGDYQGFLHYESVTEFSPFIFPAKTFKNMAASAKLNFEFPAIGFSLSWFRGYSTLYGFDIDTALITSLSFTELNYNIYLNPKTYLKNSIGLDFEIPAGRWIFREETALNLTKDYENNMYVPNPGLQYVAAVERNFGGWDFILQYIGSYTYNFKPLKEIPPYDPGTPLPDYMYSVTYNELTQFNRRIFYQQEKFNHALSLYIGKFFAHDAVRAEIMGYYNITSEEWFVRPQVSWDITDRLQVSAGGFYSKGPDKSLYYYAFQVMNGGFVQLKVSF